MYRRCSGPPDGQHSVCPVEAILDNCVTEVVLCGLSCFNFWLHHFLITVNTTEGNGNSSEGRRLCLFLIPLFYFFFFFFLPTAEITARLPGKIGAHISSVEGLKK